MDSEMSSLENKCENLMNIVVESRKRFGKMCVDYEIKSSLMENKLLNLQIETFSNYKFKSKNPVTSIPNDDNDEIDDFKVKFVEMNNRFENVRKKVKNTQDVVLQLKADGVGKRLREPVTAGVLLAKAKERKEIK